MHMRIFAVIRIQTNELWLHNCSRNAKILDQKYREDISDPRWDDVVRFELHEPIQQSPAFKSDTENCVHKVTTTVSMDAWE